MDSAAPGGMEHHVFRLGGEVGLGLDREPKHQTPIESSVTEILDVGVMSQVTYRGQGDTGHNQRHVMKVRTRTSPKIDIQGAPKVGSSKIVVNKEARAGGSRQVNPNNRLCSVLHAVCLVPVATLCVMLSLMLCCPARALGYTW